MGDQVCPAQPPLVTPAHLLVYLSPKDPVLDSSARCKGRTSGGFFFTEVTRCSTGASAIPIANCGSSLNFTAHMENSGLQTPFLESTKARSGPRLTERGIQSIADLGCGDFQLGQRITSRCDVN